MSLFNISQEVNNDSEIQTIADAEKEFQALQASRKRISQKDLDAKPAPSALGHRRAASTPGNYSDKLLSLSQIDPMSSLDIMSSRGRTQSETVGQPSISRPNTISVTSPRSLGTQQRVPRTKPTTTPKASQIYRTDCEYKKPVPTMTLRHIDFKPRFIVIDSKFKFMRIYRNERELKEGQPFKYELPLKNIQINKDKNIQQRKHCVIVKIKGNEHSFYFKTDEQRQKALEFIEICAGLRTAVASPTTLSYKLQ